MELTPKELMKQYVDSQNFTSTTQIMQAMKELLPTIKPARLMKPSVMLKQLFLESMIRFMKKQTSI